MSIGPYILLLPDVALEKIFSFLSYNEIAKSREVCKKLNEVCGKLLSRGFIQIEKRHSTIFKRMKTMLPRRESERRAHPLARHCDILSAIETRISMLNMTFSRYMELGLCCFIPGKVIDEIENILNIVEQLIPPPRTHELLQELRDISSMAMEHFEEFILPGLKAQIEQPPAIPILPSTSKSSKFVLVQCSLAEDINKVKKQNKLYKTQISQIMAQIEKINKKGKRQYLKAKGHSEKIREQERRLHEQSSKIEEQEATITDLRRHIDEWEQKFSDLTAEVRARDEFIEKPTCPAGRDPSMLPRKIRMPQNIMPRRAQPLPRALTPIGELDRKRKCALPPDAPSKLARGESVRETRASDCAKELPKSPSLTPKPPDVDGPKKSAEIHGDLRPRKSDLESFFNSLIRNPITAIKPRKRRMQEDIDIN